MPACIVGDDAAHRTVAQELFRAHSIGKYCVVQIVLGPTVDVPEGVAEIGVPMAFENTPNSMFGQNDARHTCDFQTPVDGLSVKTGPRGTGRQLRLPASDDERRIGKPSP